MASALFGATSRTTLRYKISLFLIASLGASPVEGSVFLGREVEQMHTKDGPLLAQLEKLLGSDRRVETADRATRIEEFLRPTYAAMPKGSDGGLRPETVRYLVHRYFVERHGWFVRGLDAAGDSWNSSSPSLVFKEHVGEHVQSFFEGKLCDHKGLNLEQVAVFAATLESYVHSETLERLHTAYRFSGLGQKEERASKEQVTAVMEAYMMMYVTGTNYTNVTQSVIDGLHTTILDLYPTWPETKKWVDQVREEIHGESDDSSFSATVRVLEEIGDRYGRWQNSECLDLKRSLVELEEPDSGRVRLDAFYKSALEGNWQFSESVPYLRQLGALDETDPLRPSVIISNYVNSPANCVASSKFYSVCCIDECESLLSHLELQIAAPEAPPLRIVQLVSDLSSATVQAPRALPTGLVNRLDEIANQHGGTVPLHGRLFAQWMHHAFPRECQYPHLTGTTKPLAPEVWAELTGEEHTADAQTMLWHVEEASRVGRKVDENSDDELPWAPEEELFVSRPTTHPEFIRARWAGNQSLMMLMASILSVSLFLVRMLLVVTDAVGDTVENPKYFV